MDITEKAKQYAHGKAIDALTAAIEQAYADGYNDGINHLENEKLEALKEGIDFVDLNLKSGTRWSSRYIQDNERKILQTMPYEEAAKLTIPTKEDFEELCSSCSLSYHRITRDHGIKFLGTNGKSIVINYFQIDEIHEIDDPENFYFWLKDDENSNSKMVATILTKNNQLKFNPLTRKVFMGFKLPVMLVKKVK